MLASIGAQEHIKFLSPNASSTLRTEGQNLFSCKYSNGYAAFSRVYGKSHVSEVSIAKVCGAFFRGLFGLSAVAWSISSLIAIRASQKRSNSSKFSLSVGSIISVPATGNDTVGAWNP